MALTAAEQAEYDALLLKAAGLSAGTFESYLPWLRRNIPPRWTVEADHIRVIAEHLDAVTRGEIDRLAIHMPPRHAKTETITVRYPLYRLERDHELPVLVTGYNERFARKLGRKTRNLAAAKGLVSADKSASDEWALNEGGLFMARGVGSPPTGTGFNLILIDDPIRRREDAESEVYREKVWDWYTDDLYTRLEPEGAIVLVMTLWHEDDVGARAVASEPGRWTTLKLPAFAEAADPLGRTLGAPLWPERFDAKALQRIHDVLCQNEGERSWQALYQQDPKPRTGGFFQVNKLHYLDAHELPPLVREVRAWDTAATEGSGDHTAGVRMGVCAEGRYYLSDMAFGQWGTARRNEQIRATAEADGKRVKIRFAQDPGAAGVDQVEAFTRLVAGFSVTSERCSGSKETRADPFSAQVNGGNVYLVRGAWNAPFVSSLQGFPGGKIDDPVDASADAFNELVSPAGPDFVPWFGAVSRK